MGKCPSGNPPRRANFRAPEDTACAKDCTPFDRAKLKVHTIEALVNECDVELCDGKYGSIFSVPLALPKSLAMASDPHFGEDVGATPALEEVLLILSIRRTFLRHS